MKKNNFNTNSMTVKDFINEIWFPLDIENKYKNRNTIKFYKSTSSIISEYFSNVELKSIKRCDMDLFIDYCKNGYKKKLSSGTLNNIRMLVNRIYNYSRRFY